MQCFLSSCDAFWGRILKDEYRHDDIFGISGNTGVVITTISGDNKGSKVGEIITRYLRILMIGTHFCLTCMWLQMV